MPPRFLVLLTLLAATAGRGAEPVSFSRQIRPILSENCFFCHGPDDKKREAGLRLDDETAAKSDNDGVIAIVPGHPEKSALLQRITSTDPNDVMPPPKLHKTIPADQVALLTEWIRQGAPWGNHWSYEPVVKPPVPAIIEPAATTIQNPVDAFLLARLRKEGLDFSPEAPFHALIRRAALDLTGLPPTPEELAAFAKRHSSFEEIVDHYLAKPAYGEHWAAQWLDLARYADSSGYPSDQPREIWAWRDWVVSAFNHNLPFDQFTIEQIAGDLVPGATGEQIIATAFHRNTMTQNEGGTIDEEFRVAAVVDRVNTTMAVWMGTTMACAQCHTHKYDPITITEYYQFYDLLNQTADADRKDEAPVHEIITPELREQRRQWSETSAALEKELAAIRDDWLAGFEPWLKTKPALNDAKLKTILAKPAAERAPAEVKQLQAHYVRHISPATAAQRRELGQLAKQLADTKPVTVPVMMELPPDQRRASHIQNRGEWQNLGDQVHAATPAIFHPLPDDAPRDRLALARWLVARENPLTARVLVNRYWETLFGTGIVSTSEEFGSQGELPFHPELLDWLAADLMDHGWDLKRLLKQLVTSRAYRQDSAGSQKSESKNPNLNDPENRLLTRGPRFRPSGELLRDQALAVSGLLSPKMGGPPVRPAAPQMGLSTAFGRANDWTVSGGEDRHRRSLYTEVRRNSPYASFTTFDAGNREVCMIRRNRTNTPLQAFVTLNDPVFVETHQAMARRLLADTTLDTDTTRLDHLFLLTLCRAPETKERDTLLLTLADTRNHFTARSAEAEQLATEPLGPLPPNIPPTEAAAWTTLASIVMNLDEFLMRR
jgi:mono/diheme cytochrome c family protein